jgi:hypothetical protein
MREVEPPFEITSGNLVMKVSEHRINNTAVFHVVFNDNRKPLNVTIATNSDGEKFWTSTPEGRQTEAERVGKLVGSYIRNKKMKGA